MEVASARAQLVDSTGGGATVLTTLPGAMSKRHCGWKGLRRI